MAGRAAQHGERYHADRVGAIKGVVPPLKQTRGYCSLGGPLCQTLSAVTMEVLTKPNISLNPIIIPGYIMYLGPSCLIATERIHLLQSAYSRQIVMIG